MIRTARARAPWSLRRRLVVAVVALLFAMTGVLAVTSTLALRGSLVAQLDAQLLAASERSQGAPRTGGPGGFDRPTPPDGAPAPAEPPPFLLVAGQRTGTVGLVAAGGETVQSGFLDEDAAVRELDSAQEAALLAVAPGEPPRTVDLPGLGEFRVVAHTQPSGDVIVTGLSLAEVRATEAAYLTVEAIVLGVGLLVGGGTAALLVRRSLRPLDRMAATATRVARLPLHSGEVSIAERLPAQDTDPRTETGQVGAALNEMLGHVESALAARHDSETQVRQFVADASHELRTPLASIRGYAELVRRSREPVPEQARRALERVESEAVRMTALVEDLLLLARLDAGRLLERAQVDLAGLAVDAVADAHAAGPGHRWLLDLPEEPAVVVGDAARLHQVLVNLLSNARVHAPVGTTVRLRVHPATRDAADGVEIEVHDDGPGIPAELQPVLFQRFSRGDAARTRSSDSTGLGLAIVDAVVSAHAGTITVASGPGSTTFAVWLPAAPPVVDDGGVSASASSS